MNIFEIQTEVSNTQIAHDKAIHMIEGIMNEYKPECLDNAALVTCQFMGNAVMMNPDIKDVFVWAGDAVKIGRSLAIAMDYLDEVNKKLEEIDGMINALPKKMETVKATA